MVITDAERAIIWSALLNLANGEGMAVLEQLGMYADSAAQADDLYDRLSGADNSEEQLLRIESELE